MRARRSSAGAAGAAVAVAAVGAVLLAGIAAGPAVALAAPPAKPSGPSPAHGATGVGVTAAPELCVDVADPDGGTVTVTFLGRRVGPPGEDFTVVVLPDPQFYAKTYPDLYRAQTEWIAANRDALRIAFVTGVGDMTDDGDLDGQQYQWKNAHDAFAVLEAATSEAYPDGIPYGMCIGNHDNGFAARFGGDEGATTIQYTRKFGLTRWCGGTCAGDPSRACRSDLDCVPPAACAGPVGACRSYFGGRFDFGDPAKYALNTDNNLGLFRGGGIDFAIFHLEYDTSIGPESTATLDWLADTAANAHPDRQAIVVSHWLMASAGNPPAWSSQGAAIWDRVKALPNVFLMLCGHLVQASRRTDAADDGHAVHTLLSDYQYAPYGGRGWLRVMTFSPKAGAIRVRTISPWVNYPETPRRVGTIVGHADNTAGTAQNEFQVPWAAAGSGSFETIATLHGVAAGSRACVPWPAAIGGWTHEWIAKVGDGGRTTAGPRWSFGTSCTVSHECDDADPCTSDACEAGACVRAAVPGCCRADADCDDGDACTTDGCLANACTSTRVPGCCRTDLDCEGFQCVAGPCVLANLGALDLPGGGAYADAGTGAALNDHGTGSFTVEGWFLAETAASPYAGLFGQGRQGNASQVQVQLPTSAPYNRLHVLVEAETPSYIITQVDATPIPFDVGTWHHFAAVVDRTAGAQRLRVFLDGVLADEKVATIWGSWPIRSVDSTLIGATRAPWGDPTYFLDGRLDEVRVWDRALGAEEIVAGMRVPIPAAPGLVARWSMDEAAGATAADSAGTNDATLITGAGWVAPGAAGGIADLGAGGCDWTLLDGPACDDGNACTMGDACAAGACKPGIPKDCSDLDPCTVGDKCVDGLCVAGAPMDCDDLDPCTLGDACVGGLCVAGAPMDCDDLDPCTLGDACVDGLCVAGAPTVCDDLDPCTLGDACVDGLCVAGTPMTCDDGDACTVGDACVAGECVPGTPVPGCCPAGASCDLPHPPDVPVEDAATSPPDSPPDSPNDVPADVPADAATDLPSTPDESLAVEDSATADDALATNDVGIADEPLAADEVAVPDAAGAEDAAGVEDAAVPPDDATPADGVPSLPDSTVPDVAIAPDVPAPDSPPGDTPVADTPATGDPADAATPAGPDPDPRGAGGGGCTAGGAGTGAVTWFLPALAFAAAFLRRRRVASVLPLVLAAGCAATGAIRGPWPQVTSWPGDEWPVSTPEALGMNSRPLAEAIETALAEDLPLHGVLVVRHGAVVLDASFHPFGPRDRHDVASVTKSVTGTLVGIAIGRGDLSGLDARVLDFFPERAAAASADPRRAALTLRDLLTMRSGLDCHLAPGSDLTLLHRMLRTPDWAAFALDVPLSEPPGTRFRYCSLASHLLSAILRKATGRSALDYAREHLFGPLGIRSPDWPSDPRTGDPHGWGDLALDRYDMARLGYLYLAGGRWQGRQVVPAEWVRASLSRQAAIPPFGPMDGYGYHWWTSTHGFGVAMGRGGQWVVVVPGLDLVVVLTSSGTGEVTARTADLVQRLILGAVRGPGPIPDDPAGSARLAAAVARAAASRDPAPGPIPALPPAAAAVSGTSWDLADNAYGLRSASLRFGPPGEAGLDILQEGHPPLAIRVGLDGAWRTFPGRRAYPARARGAWDDGTSFRVELDEMALISRWTLHLRFDGDRVALRIEDASGNPPATIEGVRRPAVAQ